MKRNKSSKLLRLFLWITLFTILVPMLILLIWTFADRWPWPDLLPSDSSLRSIKEILSPHSLVFKTSISSILLSLTVAFLSTLIGLMTSRALVFYDFPGKELIEFLSILPNLVPPPVFAMGVHVLLIRASLADTISGVILVHLIYSLPYSINILKNLTESIGPQLEFQGYVLGASPLKSFIFISLPLLTPAILGSMTMAYILSFSQYFLTLLIGGGRVKTLSILMVPFIAKGDRSLSSAYALVFILSTLLVFYLLDALIKRMPYQNRKGEI